MRKKESRPLSQRSKKLRLEPLEDRLMLSASKIDFVLDHTYEYTSQTGAEIKIDLERSDFIEIANVKSTKGDLISIDKTLSTVSVFENSGSTTNPYSTAPIKTEISSLGGSGKKFAVADMNRDGIADLLVVFEDSGKLVVEVYQGQSNGKFATEKVETVINVPFRIDDYSKVEGSTQRIQEIQAAGGLINQTMIRVDQLQVKDISGDGVPDLIVSLTGIEYKDVAADDVKISKGFYFTGTSSLTFSTSEKIIINRDVNTQTSLGFGKLTSFSDRPLQLVKETKSTTTDNKTRQTLYLSNYTVSSNIASNVSGSIAYSEADPRWTKIANADADDREEIISGIGYITANKEERYAISITNISTLDPVGTSPTGGARVDIDIDPKFCAIGDINNDGFVDILVSDGTSYQILLGSTTSRGSNSVNVGSYYYTPLAKVDSYVNYLATQTGDFNGDGYQDVVAVGEKHVVFFPGNPSHPDYQKGRILFDFPVKAEHVVFGDFTGDNTLDFVISSGYEGTTIFLYKGVVNSEVPGKETLFAQTAVHSVTTPDALVSGNFITKKGTENGKVDLGILRGGGTHFLVLSYSGSKFDVVSEKSTSLGSYAVQVAVGDLNGDGYDDIVTANETAGTITVAYNKGEGSSVGTFDTSTKYNVGTALNEETGIGSRPSAVAIADLTGDGLLDIGVLNAGDNMIKFYHQQNLRPSEDPFQHNTNYDVRLGDVKKGVQEYHLLFEDFDLDGRMDLIVGLTTASTQQIVVFQNKESLPGQFSTTDPSWLPATPLSGTVDGKISWGLNTGYQPGLTSSLGTPGVIVASGNSIYFVRNETKPEASQGTIEVIVRDLTQAPTADRNQYSPSAFANLQKETWMNEWGSYFIEVWGTTGESSEGISTFDCTMSFDSNIFSVLGGNIKSDNFNITATVVGETITVKGTTTSSNYGRNQYVMLFRFLAEPETSKANAGVPVPTTGYAVGVDSKFSFVSTPQMNSKNVLDAKDAGSVHVYPVIYDVNDDGVVNVSDFGLFSKQAYKDLTSGNMKFDFNHDGVINVMDFMLFSKVAYLMRTTGMSNYHYSFVNNQNFPDAWEQGAQSLSTFSSSAVVSASLPIGAAVYESVEDEQEERILPELEIQVAVNVEQDMEEGFPSASPSVISSAEAEEIFEGTTLGTLCFIPGSSDETLSSWSFADIAAPMSLVELDTYRLSQREYLESAKNRGFTNHDYALGLLFGEEEEILMDEESWINEGAESPEWVDRLFSESLFA